MPPFSNRFSTYRAPGFSSAGVQEDEPQPVASELSSSPVMRGGHEGEGASDGGQAGAEGDGSGAAPGDGTDDDLTVNSPAYNLG